MGVGPLRSQRKLKFIEGKLKITQEITSSTILPPRKGDNNVISRIRLHRNKIRFGIILGTMLSLMMLTLTFGLTWPTITKAELPSRSSNLSITKIVTPTLAIPGDTITYTLIFSNSTLRGTSTGVIITDIVPISITNTSVVSSGATITQTNVGVLTYTWQVQNLDPNDGGIITITGILKNNLPVGVLTNTAIITTTASEINTANNSASATLQITKSLQIHLPVIVK